MAAFLIGMLDWRLRCDEKGYRDYFLDLLIGVEDARNDGPGTVFSCPDLAPVGSQWAYGDEIDPWAVCRPDWEVRAANNNRGEPIDLWICTQRYSTKPLGRDNGTPPGNPLLEPADIGGTFVKFKKEAVVDKEGAALLSSSLEVLRGPQVERDYNLPTVTIGKNYATLPLGDIASFIDCKSSGAMWGLAAGQVKLSNVRWQKLYYGLGSYYYKITYEFDVDYDKFLKRPVDEGTRVYKGSGDATDPKNYIMYRDGLDEIGGRILLNGSGAPLVDATDPYYFEKDLYPEANLLLLGIPSTL